MLYEFDGPVDITYPPLEGRPSNLRTFMLVGVAVTWSAAPTTSENITLHLGADLNGIEMTPLIRVREPAADMLQNWVLTIDEGPIPLPVGVRVRVQYLNTDANTVKILFLGYWM